MRESERKDQKRTPLVLFCFVLEGSEEVWREGFGPREPPSLGFRDLPVRPGCAHRPGEIKRQLERVASSAATVVPHCEGVGAQHRCRDAAEGAGPG